MTDYMCAPPCATSGCKRFCEPDQAHCSDCCDILEAAPSSGERSVSLSRAVQRLRAIEVSCFCDSASLLSSSGIEIGELLLVLRAASHRLDLVRQCGAVSAEHRFGVWAFAWFGAVLQLLCDLLGDITARPGVFVDQISVCEPRLTQLEPHSLHALARLFVEMYEAADLLCLQFGVSVTVASSSSYRLAHGHDVWCEIVGSETTVVFDVWLFIERLLVQLGRDDLSDAGRWHLKCAFDLWGAGVVTAVRASEVFLAFSSVANNVLDVDRLTSVCEEPSFLVVCSEVAARILKFEGVAGSCIVRFSRQQPLATAWMPGVVQQHRISVSAGGFAFTASGAPAASLAALIDQLPRVRRFTAAAYRQCWFWGGVSTEFLAAKLVNKSAGTFCGGFCGDLLAVFYVAAGGAMEALTINRSDQGFSVSFHGEFSFFAEFREERLRGSLEWFATVDKVITLSDRLRFPLPSPLNEQFLNLNSSRARVREIAVALQELDLPVLVTLEIIDAHTMAHDVRMWAKWEVLKKVKHFGRHD